MGKGGLGADIENESDDNNMIADEKDQTKIKKSKAFKSEFEQAEELYRNTKFNQKVQEILKTKPKKVKTKP
eukprot:CAMPEP_0114590150 /NCGR_PEP_ID=MMETSP0125-20121206/12450_1 /TAXON_ID=485358 ORGANISM="Aristerostoma sp., Strain ATCC 50986" /NCGR_SAMPLE_ID=MMETSP0125 /ASSEMBLY_ACC=CAM_ASM_000245 /LENGTH=70 /DNA_ID=CAMNT_0001787453 /DNA_START=38 /DNA_END=250 /DNA_ORIENTATION=+